MTTIIKGRRSGFTLIELLVVMTISVVLGGAFELYLRSHRGDIQRHAVLDAWNSRSRAALELIARDVRQSPSLPSWSEESLWLSAPDGDPISYTVVDVDGRQCLVRRFVASENTTVLAPDVARFEVEYQPWLLHIGLDFFAWNDSYRVSATHETNIALPRRSEL